MISTGDVTVSVEVAVYPITAFIIFTDEISRWWQPDPIHWNNPYWAIGACIEPGVGGAGLKFTTRILVRSLNVVDSRLGAR